MEKALLENLYELEKAMNNSKEMVNIENNRRPLGKKGEYQRAKADFYKYKSTNLVRTIQEQCMGFKEYIVKSNPDNETILEIIRIANDCERIVEELPKLIELVEKANLKSEDNGSSIRLPANLPREIRQEVIADLNELERCYNSGCYRAATIICGRIIETSLHRKYFDVTGIDLLEKNPGIGLGKLIAKMSEKNISLDPGLSHQIHLINQVRIYSVHKKSESFYPSKEQTHAIVLYTLDVLEKLF